MRRISVAVIICLLISTIAGAEGLLPELDSAFGTAMPSLGDVTHRYPENETLNDDGSTVQVWLNVTNSEFEAFSNYLGTVGASLQDYSVDGAVFNATIGKNGETFEFSYDSSQHNAIVKYPKGTYDERLSEAQAHYNAAKAAIASSDFKEAYYEFLQVKDYELYKDVDTIIQTDENILSVVAAIHEERLNKFKTIGGTVTFGSYEQDNNRSNGKEPIEWIVLDVQDNKALLISKYGLEAKPYNTKDTRITWEGCTLRKWLNNEFINAAFSEEERSAILLTNVDNSQSQGYWSIDGGNNTQDNIFLLSFAEANKYFNVTYNDSNNTKASTSPTAYAKAKGALISGDIKTSEGEAAGLWWLRSPGKYMGDAAFVSCGGNLYANDVDDEDRSVRPVFYINLESGIF